jgi:Uma2 family endonuclease
MPRPTTSIDLYERPGLYNDHMSTTALTPLPIHRLDVETYGRMVASGALEGEPVELLEGLLVEMSPQGPDHMAVVRRLVRHLSDAPGWLQVQDRLEVSPDWSPQPDVALLAEEPPPGQLPRTALFVAEVAVTSHISDRNVKAPAYARAGVRTYWLIDVPGRTVEVRTDPGSEDYRKCETYGMGARLPSPAPGVDELDVGWLLEQVGR